MKLKKTSESYNSVFKRRELVFFIDHVSSGTPRLYDVRKSLAKEYNANEDNVYILKLNTLAGTNQTLGIAVIYDHLERAEALIAKHIKMRNLPTRRDKKG